MILRVGNLPPAKSFSGTVTGTTFRLGCLTMSFNHCGTLKPASRVGLFNGMSTLPRFGAFGNVTCSALYVANANEALVSVGPPGIGVQSFIPPETITPWVENTADIERVVPRTLALPDTAAEIPLPVS